MMKKFSTLVAAFMLLSFACGLQAKPVKNVIFMIGDGMSMTQVYSAVVATGEPLTMMGMPYATMQETQSADSKITDSAASGTALACGVKTKNHMLGMNPDSVAVESIMDLAARNGKTTGEVVTCYITHATPAAYVAHQVDRGYYEPIAKEYVDHGPDVFLGGGLKYFEARKDSCNLSDSLRAKGYEVVYSLEDALNSPSDKLVALLADGHMKSMKDGRGDYLPKAVDLAIRKLDKNKKGFFLMVEGSQIDMRCHSNDINGCVAEVLDFDQAVAVALDFAKRDGNTLVVVTADHETGGLALLQTTPVAEGQSVKSKFSTTGHTGIPVPVFAYGPGAENYCHMIQNSDHKAILTKLMKLK